VHAQGDLGFNMPHMPMLLDFLTVFFIVAGCALLWLNLRHRRPRIIITKTDSEPSSAPTRLAQDNDQIHALIAALQPPASHARAGPEPEDAQEFAKRFAEGMAKAKKPPS
jgi:hypothetical protein